MKIDRFTIILLMNSVFISCFSQNNINHIDHNGLKQGLWVNNVTIKIVDSMNYRNDTLSGVYKSYKAETGDLRFIGNYQRGIKVGTWKFYDKNVLVAEEVDRGMNNQRVIDEFGKTILPKYYSYIILYNRFGVRKREGRVLYYDSWDSDFSNKHGVWKYFDEKGQYRSSKQFSFGRIIDNNVR